MDDVAFIIDPIAHCELNDEEIEILQEAVRKIQEKRKKRLINSLKQASEIVASWPKWKRDLADRVLLPTRRG